LIVRLEFECFSPRIEIEVEPVRIDEHCFDDVRFEHDQLRVQFEVAELGVVDLLLHFVLRQSCPVSLYIDLVPIGTQHFDGLFVYFYISCIHLQVHEPVLLINNFLS